MQAITASVGDFSRMSGMSRATIYRRINDGDLQSVKLHGKRLVLVGPYIEMVKSMAAQNVSGNLTSKRG